jgi:uncharacterized protein (DUF2141 family)
MRIPPLLVVAVMAVMAGSAVAEARQRSGGPPVLEAPKGTGAISGVVADATTGKPIEGAIVGLGVTTGGSIILTLPRMVTDAKGRFLFRDLAPSTKYYIRASCVGYAPARFGASGPRVVSDRVSDLEITTADDIVTISVAADQWVSDLQVKLWRPGSITGRITDERGEPVVGVAVRGFSSVLIAGHSQFVGSDVVTTDDRGEYRLANLMPGKYAVSVLSVQSTVLDTTPEAAQKNAVGALVSLGTANPGLPAIDVDGRHRIALSNFATPPPPSAAAPRAYAAQFYPGTPSLSSARLIDIDYGTLRRGVDFQLQPVATVSVSGRLDGAGDASSMLLRLMPAGSEQLGAGSEAATTIVEPGGSFTFLNVPAGEYTLLAQAVFGDVTRGTGDMRMPDAPGFSAGEGQFSSAFGRQGLSLSSRTGKVGMWGRAGVSVGATNITDLVVPLHPPVTVRGRVVMDSVSGMRLGTMIGAQPANGDLSLGNIGTYLQVNGTTPFTLEGLGSGIYLLGIPTYSARYVSLASITSGGREIRDTGLDTTSGRDIDDVVITLTENVTSIQGTVRGDGAAGATVIAFPTERERWSNYGADPARIMSKAADNDGAFVLTGLPDGDYFAVAVDGMQHDAWADPKFLEAAAALATRISLKVGEKKSLDLAISKVVVK